MTKVWIAAGTALALAAGPAVAQQKTIRIGLI
jgi:ABC-type sugar transport system substrate-binding protein